MFDAPFADGEDRLVGHEMAQEQLVTLLRNFVDERRVNRLILLHGPNGSAKSSFVACLMRALEAYSQTDEGALYRFNWIFPTRLTEAGRLGFGSTARTVEGQSYAHLDDLQIDARLSAEANDNPLFLLDVPRRLRLLEPLLAAVPDFALSDGIRRGELGQRSRAIVDALTTAYRGDLRRVFRHVQVERFYVSRTYRRAAVTVEPQIRVDAGVRQITADRSLASLPTALQSQTLFETYGPLVEGNRGLIEFNDLLKRPMEANKYLLATSEKGTVSLDHAEMRLDAVLMATGNEVYLEAFKGQADWASYKGRIELIRMPYLLDYRAEQRIYDDLLASVKLNKPVMPHTTYVLALWAVLTRLRRPDVTGLPSAGAPLVAALTPLQKARLYAADPPPAGLAADEAQMLRAAVHPLFLNGASEADYEGRFGASAREMKMLLLSALHRSGSVLSPLTILRELQSLVKDKSVYEWLQLDPEGDYRRPEQFVQIVRDAWLDRAEVELRTATRLVDDAEYSRVFDRYIMHVNHWLRNEKLTDPLSGRVVAADERMMEEVEQTVGRREDARAWRAQLINQVAAFRIDNPDEAMDFARIFPRLLERMRVNYHESKRNEVARIGRDILVLVRTAGEGLDAPSRVSAEQTLQVLREQYGYEQDCASEMVSTLLTSRYQSTSR